MLEPGTARGRFRLHDLMRELARLNQPEARFGDAALRHAGPLPRGARRCGRPLPAGRRREHRRRAEALRPGAHQHRGGPGLGRGAARRPVGSRRPRPADFPDAGVYVLDLRQHSRTRIEWLERGLDAARTAKTPTSRGKPPRQSRHRPCRSRRRPAPPSTSTSRRSPSPARSATAAAREATSATSASPMPTSATPAPPSTSTSRRSPSPARSATGAARETTSAISAAPTPTLGDTRTAIDFYEQALAIAREIGDRRGEGNHLGNLGSAHADSRRHPHGHRLLRAGAGHRPRDRRPARRGKPPRQSRHRPCRSRRAPAPRSTSTSRRSPSPARSATGAARETTSAISAAPMRLSARPAPPSSIGSRRWRSSRPSATRGRPGAGLVTAGGNLNPGF